MLKVVSNTTPLISLMKINKLFILEELYNEIIIPQEGYGEIQIGKNKQYYMYLSKVKWSYIKQISD